MSELIVGSTDKQPLLETPGEFFELRKLLPTSLAYDFNIHIMDFQPGEFLNVKEVHYNQHGLLILEGQGIYRLGNSWFPVEAGDAIWMAPFVPQWYGTLGKTRSRYLLDKDDSRNPLLNCIVTKRFIQDCGRVKITTTLMVPWTFKAHNSTWEKILEIGLTVIVTERVIIATAVAAGAPGKLGMVFPTDSSS